MQAIERAIGKEGWKIVLLLRLSPAVPFTAVNYVAGLTCISFWNFMWPSAIGLVPGTYTPPCWKAVAVASRQTPPVASYQELALAFVKPAFLTSLQMGGHCLVAK